MALTLCRMSTTRETAEEQTGSAGHSETLAEAAEAESPPQDHRHHDHDHDPEHADGASDHATESEDGDDSAGIGFWAVTAVLVVCFLFRGPITDALDSPAVQTWTTVFVSLVIQATPFLVFGVAIAAAIAAYIPVESLNKVLPKKPVLAVPAATAAGALLPGCECASVPISNSLIKRGITPAAALAFLLAAPAINPIVIVSTAVAFPGQWDMVAARFIASFLVAVAMGWLWLRLGKTEWLIARVARHHDHANGSRWRTFRDSMQHDFLHAGGFLVIGAMIAAAVNTLVPKDVVQYFADNPWLSVVALALLAFVVAVCSEADAFVAASFQGFSDTAKLAFMVVGPAIDVKLASMQLGTFGPKFTARFAPATLVVAILSSVLVGWWLL